MIFNKEFFKTKYIDTYKSTFKNGYKAAVKHWRDGMQAIDFYNNTDGRHSEIQARQALFNKISTFLNCVAVLAIATTLLVLACEYFDFWN